MRIKGISISVSSKIILLTLFLAILGVALSAILVSKTALVTGQSAMENQFINQLLAINQNKKFQVESFFQQMENQIIVLSLSHTTVEAMKKLDDGLNRYGSEFYKTHDFEKTKGELTSFYINQFERKYTELNPDRSFNHSEFIDQLDRNSIALQHSYIVNNPQPLGSKNNFNFAQDGTTYSSAHALYHPYFNENLKRFGYYNIFLVNPESGKVVYSVFKQVDIGSSLLTPPQANTKIAEAFRLAKDIKQPGQIVLTDFSPYAIAYEGQAAFLATPIFDNNERIGILIFQLPIERINRIMMSSNLWESYGMGRTGESYLISQDGFMRSNSRFLIQYPDMFYQQLENNGISSSTIETIKTKKTTIGMLSANSMVVKAIRDGKAGIYNNVKDYRNINVYEAYSPINIMGLKWGIITQFDTDEIFHNEQDLTKLLFNSAMLSTFCIVIVVFAIGLLLTRRITSPIEPMTEFSLKLANGDLDADTSRLKFPHDDIGDLSRTLLTLQKELLNRREESENAKSKQDNYHSKEREIAEHNSTLMRELETVLKRVSTGDLTQVIEHEFTGEFRLIPEYLNNAVSKLKELISNILAAGETVKHGVQEIADGNRDLNQRTEEQAASISQTASSMDKFATSVKETSTRATEASELVEKACTNAEAGGKVVLLVSDAMSNINQSSNKIVSIISVIDEIAFQTNLLALNAAVEAARAGEQGRGFAVVAAEVRNLAQRSAQAAKEIKELINDSVTKVASGTQLVADAKKTLDEIIKAIEIASTMMKEIATAAKEQSVRIQTVNRAVSELESITQQNAALVEQAAAASTEIDEHTSQMVDLLATFTVKSNVNELDNTAAMHPAVFANDMRDTRHQHSRPTRTAHPIGAPQQTDITKQNNSSSTAADDEWESF